MSALPILETARLRLRGIGPDDASAMFPVLSDDALMTWWSSAAHRDVAETRAYLTYTPDPEAMRSWAITLCDGSPAIGWVTVIRRRPGVNEIGYILARDHWGSGIASEAVARVLDLLFRDEGQRRVFADIDPDNSASCSLVERLGFRREGLLRGAWETHIGVRDSVIYGLLRDEWLTARPVGRSDGSSGS
ncbi:GNAT family N-acetyltransferase [Sphingomonas sp. ST-64]|uniref:GNAT family N-acetyltransferase n=1 Tax=Sphingomonas plantiphila TaxID=3163295 RepID=A0ABW8YL02_9SPHN